MLAYNPELNLHLRDHVIVCILATWPAGCGPPGGGASRLLLLACRQSVAMCGDATELGGMRDQRVQYSRPKFSPGSIALLQHGVSVAVVAAVRLCQQQRRLLRSNTALAQLLPSITAEAMAKAAAARCCRKAEVVSPLAFLHPCKQQQLYLWAESYEICTLSGALFANVTQGICAST